MFELGRWRKYLPVSLLRFSMYSFQRARLPDKPLEIMKSHLFLWKPCLLTKYWFRAFTWWSTVLQCSKVEVVPGAGFLSLPLTYILCLVSLYFSLTYVLNCFLLLPNLLFISVPSSFSHTLMCESVWGGIFLQIISSVVWLSPSLPNLPCYFIILPKYYQSILRSLAKVTW